MIYVLMHKRSKYRIASSKKPEHPELEVKLHEEITIMRQDGVIVTGNIIIAHAFAIARNLQITSFSGSRGWLHGFLKRENTINTK